MSTLSDKMLKDLGFVKSLNKWDKEGNRSWGQNVFLRYYNKRTQTWLTFDLLDEDYSLWCEMFGGHMTVAINFELHKAISEKIYELKGLK